MGDFFELWTSRHEVVEELHTWIADADASRETEGASCVKIQRLYRGQVVRAAITLKSNACTSITRVYRGHQARKFAVKLSNSLRDLESLAVFHYHAIALQRTFRGYYSRKFYHDYAARKKYIESVRIKGDELRRTLSDYHQTLVEEDYRKQEEEEAKEFAQVTQNLHHLVSTASINGIYNPPYAPEIPSVNGVPLEYHLRSGIKDLLRTRGYTKRGLETDLRGSKRIPVNLPSRRLSLQASSKYDAVLEEERIQKKLSRRQQMGSNDFHAGQRVRETAYRRGLNEGSQYMDPWKNPYLVRGIPQNQAELAQSRTTIGKAPSVHFYSAVGGNKSTVLPNGLFDVIAEAEQSGGVCQRHQSSSTRFGIPDTCDVREESEFLPPIPLPSSNS